MSGFQDAISPRRVVTLGGRNYEIGEIGPGVFSDFEAEVRAQRIRELRTMNLSPLEFGESVAALQRGCGAKEEAIRALQSLDGMFTLIWVVLRKSNSRLTLAETKAIFDAEPSALDDVMAAMGMKKDEPEEADREIGVPGETDSKNARAAQA